MSSHTPALCSRRRRTDVLYKSRNGTNSLQQGAQETRENDVRILNFGKLSVSVHELYGQMDVAESRSGVREYVVTLVRRTGVGEVEFV